MDNENIRMKTFESMFFGRIPIAEIIASVEEGIFPLDDDVKRLVRAEVSSIRRCAKIPKKYLKKDPDRVILSADKGNCVVVIDKHEYREKALSLLNDRNTYSILKYDPTGKIQKILNAKLLLLRKSNIISKATYEKLYSSDGLSPRFYGLPKIHRLEIPLRPIVSFVNTPTYGVSRGKTLKADQVLVSFYVVSLFPNIPVDLAIKVATKRLRQDATYIYIYIYIFRFISLTKIPHDFTCVKLNM